MIYGVRENCKTIKSQLLPVFRMRNMMNGAIPSVSENERKSFQKEDKNQF